MKWILVVLPSVAMVFIVWIFLPLFWHPVGRLSEERRRRERDETNALVRIQSDPRTVSSMDGRYFQDGVQVYPEPLPRDRNHPGTGRAVTARVKSGVGSARGSLRRARLPGSSRATQPVYTEGIGATGYYDEAGVYHRTKRGQDAIDAKMSSQELRDAEALRD